jgi:hypothetical protein
VAAPSKKARKIRTSEEFARDVNRLLMPPRASKLLTWSLEAIAQARDCQLRGQFYKPVQMATAMRTDDAQYTAYKNRLAPQQCTKVEMVPADSTTRAKSIAVESESLFGQNGIGITPQTIADIHSSLVDHNLAIGIIDRQPREDASRVDTYLRFWSLSSVRWDEFKRVLVTQVEGGQDEEIHHGDGRWIVFAKHEDEPWTKDAAIIPGASVWGIHAFALKDWAKGSRGHGLAKIIAQLKEGTPLQKTDETGKLTDEPSEEAQAMLDLLEGFADGDSPVGLAPSGSTTSYLSNAATNWNIFDKLVTSREQAFARIYLGTDGTLGSKGGAPGVDIETLFGVAATHVEGDLRCIEDALLTGIIEVWTAVNFGDSKLAPKRRYILPDRDADAARDAEHKRRGDFFAAIELAKKNGFEITADYVDTLRTRYALPETPVLPDVSKRAPTIALAPTDIARVVTVNEARASAGLPELRLPDGQIDPAGRLTVESFAARATAVAAAPPAAAATVLRAVPGGSGQSSNT